MRWNVIWTCLHEIHPYVVQCINRKWLSLNSFYHLLVTQTDTKHLYSPAIILPVHAQKLSVQTVLHTQTGTDVDYGAMCIMGNRRGRETIRPKCNTSPYLDLQCSSLQTTKTTEIEWKADWCYRLKDWVEHVFQIKSKGWKGERGGRAAARKKNKHLNFNTKGKFFSLSKWNLWSWYYGRCHQRDRCPKHV